MSRAAISLTEASHAEPPNQDKETPTMNNQDLGPAKTFFAFMTSVMASDLTPSQRLILIVQAKHADAHDGTLTGSYPSQETIARETGISVSTIKRERPKLVELGWMIQTHRGRGGSSSKSNAFDLVVPKSKAHGEPLQSVMVSPCNSSPRALATAHDEPTSTPSSTPSSAPSSTSDEKVERAKDDLPEWDGDVSRLIPPPGVRLPDGVMEYFVRADGRCRLARGRVRPGEVFRVKIDFMERKSS